MEEEVQPWERQPGENKLWYGRFWVWMQDDRRSLTGLYNIERARKGQKPAVSPPAAWREAKIRHHWEERAAAWDAYRERQALEAVLKAERKIQEAAGIAAAKMISLLNVPNDARMAAADIMDRAGITRKAEVKAPGLLENIIAGINNVLGEAYGNKDADDSGEHQPG